jgi:hypothetical protein
MVNEVVLNYLSENRGKYDINLLKDEILKKGYSSEDFYGALKELDAKKFQPNSLSKLPSGNVVEEEKKGMGFLTFFIILFLIFLFGLGLVLLFNYLGFDFFGFNFFRMIGMR